MATGVSLLHTHPTDNGQHYFTMGIVLNMTYTPERPNYLQGGFMGSGKVEIHRRRQSPWQPMMMMMRMMIMMMIMMMMKMIMIMTLPNMKQANRIRPNESLY